MTAVDTAPNRTAPPLGPASGRPAAAMPGCGRAAAAPDEWRLVALGTWTDWPSPEAVQRVGMTPVRRHMARVSRTAGLVAVVWVTLANEHLTGVRLGLVIACAVVGVAAIAGFVRAAACQSARSSGLLLALLYACSVSAGRLGGWTVSISLLCALSALALPRLPLGAGGSAVLLLTLVYFLGGAPSELRQWSNAAIVLGCALLGYLGRLDWEARGNTVRLLEQERLARAAEAETAALAERARIAREIHDVLAHSLSAQLVHLEAARLLLDSGAPREQLRQRIVTARQMAQEGLSETKQALSALRGDFVPVGEYLAELAAEHRAELLVEGVARPVPAEPAQALRRAAQEALTNVRRHGGGERAVLRLAYGEDAVELEVENPVPRGPVEPSPGSGYGLLGMRERAELLGGSLEAGPAADGKAFRVRLRLPL